MAVPREQGRAQHPAPLGPALDGHLDQTVQHVRLGSLGQQRPQPVGLSNDDCGRAHRQTSGAHGLADRGVGSLGERVGHGHDLAGTTGAGRRRVLADPLRDRQRPRSVAGVATTHRLDDDRDPGRLTRRSQGVHLIQQLAQPTSARDGPQLGVDALHRLARSRESLASLLNSGTHLRRPRKDESWPCGPCDPRLGPVDKRPAGSKGNARNAAPLPAYPALPVSPAARPGVYLTG